jgi:hypothetical protein
LFVVSFRKDEYEAIAPIEWQQRFGGVHRVAAQMALGAVGHWANREKFDGEIAYFYEAGDEDEASVHDAFVKFYADPVQRAHMRMAATPVGVPKGKARGLEVADFLAWHWNKDFADRISKVSSIRPFGDESARGRFRPQRKDLQALMKVLNNTRQRECLDVRLYMGDALEEFLLAYGCSRPPSGV